MKSSSELSILLAALLLPCFSADAWAGDKRSGQKITWKKTVVDKNFRSEGVAVADFNKDGKMDIFVGDVWYEAPDWKMHVIRREKPWDPNGYSEAFGCFADDFTGDGYPDVIVIPFPGAACKWYENPGKSGGKWKEHLLTTSACNETPIYVDLFGAGKKVLIMGWQPKGKNNEGEMAYFTPGKDPTQPWNKHAISGPSQPGKEVPGTQQFSHGLGHGDINGDKRLDVIIPQGWWEQPEKIDGTPWKFHPANISQTCADMHAFDVDGDGKNDVLSSSAHGYGLWWSQQKAGKDGPSFVLNEFFPFPDKAAALPKDHKLSPDDVELFKAVNKVRADLKRAPWRIHPKLCSLARRSAGNDVGQEIRDDEKTVFEGDIKWGRSTQGATFNAEKVAKELMPDFDKMPKLGAPGLEIGVGVARKADGAFAAILMVGERGQFSLPGQTHALHFVDMDGDGHKDLVTGRRWWAHGKSGDVSPADPAYLYWFQAKRDSTGVTTFTPHLIDDDSGIATQFAVIDINGDGIPDVVVSNKRGVFVFEQVRTPIAERSPGSKE